MIKNMKILQIMLENTLKSINILMSFYFKKKILNSSNLNSLFYNYRDSLINWLILDNLVFKIHCYHNSKHYFRLNNSKK